MHRRNALRAGTGASLAAAGLSAGRAQTYAIIPPTDDQPLHGHAWVPIDDESCFAWNFTHHSARDLTQDEIASMKRGEGICAELIPGTFCTVANKDNDYLMDRAAQKSGRSYSGIKGVAMQDASLQESMGTVVERELEHLVASDMAIVQARRRMLAAIGQSDLGGTPPGHPPSHHVRSAAFFLPADTSPADAGPMLARATRAEPSVGHTSV